MQPPANDDELHMFCQERTAAFYQRELARAVRNPQVMLALVAERLRANLASGRAQRLLGLPAECWPLKPVLLGYIDRLLRCGDSVFDQLVRLQAGDEQAWQELQDALCAFAGRTLAKAGMHPAFAAERAPELANQTCLSIFLHPYPGDVDFMAWACRILLNHFRSAARSTDIAARFPERIVSLDRAPAGAANQPLYDYLPDPAAGDALARAELRAQITQWLDSALDDRQREVIRATYFAEQADAEIARALDLTAANVQLIRYRALRRLRRAADRVKESE